MSYLIQREETDNDAEDSEASEEDAYVSGRLLDNEKVQVGKIGSTRTCYKKEDKVSVSVKPSLCTKAVKVKWMPDTGVKKTLIAEKHFRYVAKANPEVILKESKLKNEVGGQHTTEIYVVDGEQESLLGREDAITLGILNFNPKGTNAAVLEKEDSEGQKEPQYIEKLGKITPEIKKEVIKEGIVSGGQTQQQIDADMENIVKEFAHVF